VANLGFLFDPPQALSIKTASVTSTTSLRSWLTHLRGYTCYSS
jgi:hypothetical protein